MSESQREFEARRLAFEEGPIQEILRKMFPPKIVVDGADGPDPRKATGRMTIDEPVVPKTLTREPIEKKDGLDKTELYGWHCSEEGPRSMRGGLILQIPIMRGAPASFKAEYVVASSRLVLARRFRRVSGSSRTFIEEGVATYDGETGKIVDCPCASCTEGWTKPGQVLKSYGLPIEKAS
jgi:hypothetical protein